MADKYVKWSGGGYLLEDLSGYYILDPSDSITPDAGSLVTSTAVVPVTITPPSGWIVADSVASTVNVGSAGSSSSPAAGALALSGNVVTLTRADFRAPTAAAVVLAGLAPLVSLQIAAQPSVGALSLQGNAPTVSVSGGVSIQPSAGSLSTAGNAPSLVSGTVVTPVTGELIITHNGFIPVVPDTVGLTLTGNAPTVSASGTGSIQPSAGALTFTGYVSTQDLTLPAPLVGALVLSGNAPTVTVGGNASQTPSAGALVLSGLAPTISVSGSYAITPTVGALTLAGNASSLLKNDFRTPTSGSMALSGQLAGVGTGTIISPSVGSLGLAGNASSLLQSLYSGPVEGQLSLSGNQPGVAISFTGSISGAEGSLSLQGYAPGVANSGDVRATSQDAGRRTGRRRYFVEINGQVFDVLNAEHARALLEQASELAKKSAFAEAEQVVQKLNRVKRIGLATPKVVANVPELDIAPYQEKIAKAYRDAEITAELMLLFQAKQKAEDDDAAILLLM